MTAVQPSFKKIWDALRHFLLDKNKKTTKTWSQPKGQDETAKKKKKK